MTVARTQTLTCASCGAEWDREIRPGSRPRLCAICMPARPERDQAAARASRLRYEARHKAEQAARRAAWAAAHRDDVNARRAVWRAENRERVNDVERDRRARVAAADPTAAYLRKKRHTLRSVYGLEIGDYDALLARQGNGCAICRTSPEKPYGLHVDHDHETGEVRGLLCGQCNVMLGMGQDDPVLLFAAIEYLEETR